MIINKALYPVSSNLQTITNMHKKLESLQLQLASGNRYNTLAEMGTDRVHHLNLEARLNRISGYQANILTVENRMSFYTNGLERLDEIEASARALAVPSAYGTDGINLANVKNQSTNLLKEVIDVLNTDITGQYIFGGNASDRQPVASFDEIMEGPDGFREFVKTYNQRHGADGQGLVTTSIGTPGTVSLASDADAALGIQLQSVVSESAAIVGTGAAGSFDVSFGDDVQPGDTIKVGYKLPNDDNKIFYLTMTAVSADIEPVPANSFQVSANGVTTAENFEEAVKSSLEHIAKGELRSVSTYMAADDFFVGRGHDGAEPPMRWYRGQEVLPGENPRQTVSAAIDENTKASYGVTANESGFVELIKGLAVFAVSEFQPLYDANGERIEENAAGYDAMVDLQRARLSEMNNAQPGSIEGITMELGIAASTVNTVKERHTQYTAQLETMLADISAAPREEVAMMLLTLQTQLQASYQATAMASQLTLVNYL